MLAALAACFSLSACGGDDAAPGAAATAASAPAPTGILAITINSAADPAAPSQNPTFGGTTFGPVGAYQKIIGTATGKIDPNDPHNAMTTDLQLAPRDAQGLVSYSMDFYILTPVDPSKDNHKVFFEPPNRGGKQFARFNGSSGGNNPSSAADAGYTMVWAGWEPTTSRSNFSMGVTAPVAVS